MKLPTQWSEVTLKQYIEVSEVSLVDMDEIDKQVKILAILSNEDEDKILGLSLTQIKEANRAIGFIYQLPDKINIKSVIKLKGKRYAVNHRLSQLTGGEYIDLSEYTKDKENITPNLHCIISIFFHPVNIFGQRKKDSYIKNSDGNYCQKLESRNTTAKLIKDNLKMNDVFALSAFFLKSWESLINCTVDYSVNQAKKANKELEKVLSQSIGVGI